MDAVESVGFRCDARILELNSYENRVYQIGIEDAAPVIGKFYRPDRWSDKQIIEEHDFSIELSKKDISAVPPMDLGGSTLRTWADFRFALYERRGGRAPDFDNLENLEILGRHIGRIHSVGAGKQFKYRPTLSVEEYGEQTRTYLIKHSFIPFELQGAYDAVTSELLNRLKDVLKGYRYIRLHGDCHIGNILWRDDLPHFVDFDDARSGPAIQDLWMMLSGDMEEKSQQMSRILYGYRAFYEFDLKELRLIEPLRTLRIMYHAGWLARRWDDPAFPRAFPFFNTHHYWSEQVQQLREQLEKLDQTPLQLFD